MQLKTALGWLRRILLVVTALVLVAAGVAIAVVHTSWGHNQIRLLIVDALQRDFPGSTIGSVTGSPFGTIVLKGVTLNALDQTKLVTVGEARLQGSIGPLLFKRIRIDDLAVSGVHVFVRPHPSVPDVDAREPPPPPLDWAVELPAITVNDFVVTIETATGTELIDQLVVHAAARIPVGSPMAAAASIEGRWRGKPLHAQAIVSLGERTQVHLATVTLADASLVASNVELGDYTFTGSLIAHVPAALVRELTTQEVPGEVTVIATGRPRGAVSLDASAGSARVTGELVVDFVALTARGIMTAEAPDLAALTHGELVGGGKLVTAIEAGVGRARGIAVITGTARDTTGTTTVAFDAWRTHVDLVANGSIPTGGGVAYATAERRDDAWVLVGSELTAEAHDLEIVDQATLTVSADGVIYPVPALKIRSTIVGTGVHTETTRVARVTGDIGGDITGAHQHLLARLTATDLRAGTTYIPDASVEADAVIDFPSIILALGPHRVRTQDGALWTGTGGKITVTPSAIVIDDFKTGTGASRVTANGRVSLLDDSLRLKATARGVALSVVEPTLGGTADADLDVSRLRGQWAGTANVRAHDVAVPGQPVVDGTLAVRLAGRRVSLDGSVTNPQLGTVTVAGVVIGPRHLTNMVAWQALSRAAIDHITLTFAHIDAAALGQTGTLDGEVTIGATDTHGELHVRGVETSAGVIDADMTLAAGAGQEIELHATAQTPGIPPSTVDVTFVLPARPFDLRAWRLYGREALRSATIKTAVHIDPELLARFGVSAPYHGDLSATVTVLPGAVGASVSVDVLGLAGGKLMTPIDVHLDAHSDAAGITAEIRAQSGKVVVTVAARTPRTLLQLIAPGAAKAAPIEGTVTIPDVAARDLMVVLGRTDVIAGTLGGTVTIGGTIAEPTAHAVLAAHGLAVKSSTLTNKGETTLETLDIDATYKAGLIALSLTGDEGNDRRLKLSAHGNFKDLGSVVGTLEATNFDVAPLAAFGSGPIRGARGTLDGSLEIHGADPETGSIRGKLTLRDGRMPLSAELGTMRHASLDIDIHDQRYAVTFDGRLGSGDGSVSGKVTGDIIGVMPTTAHLEMKLVKVSPIGAVQPEVDAEIRGNWADLGNHQWDGSMQIVHATIHVPPEQGNELLTTGTPDDMIFVDKHVEVKRIRRPPTKPWLITKIAIGDTDVDVEDADFRIRVEVRGKLTVEIGDGIGIYGELHTTHGVMDLAGRRYRIEQAVVNFDDGTLDPRIDIRTVHDFKAMTLKVDIDGRASKPIPHLSSEPGTYTEGQLLSFLAGAEPSDQDSTAQQNEAAVSGGLAILSGRIGKRINKHLPIKFDSINYEADSTSSSKAIRFGIQLTEKSYLVWRQHVAPRPDENHGEAVFEYQLLGNMIFEATIGERAQGGDFLWRKRW